MTHCVWGLLHIKLHVVVKRPAAGVVRKFGEGGASSDSSSSSGHVSNLRGPSPNSPRVASKRDVNITRLLLSVNCIPKCFSLHLEAVAARLHHCSFLSELKLSRPKL
ncbi:hypothetical protein AVEN_78060-1 [Araneus ventricosus]|uniref:Uncharacterized protein n=1 Tax=Araneus ventricosus TaxID=182803 RepID=A0A4Y2VBJ2_ARAVE|nr:hypothetical protein AVEN_78060-1 [Araneus ventricosus]